MYIKSENFAEISFEIGRPDIDRNLIQLQLLDK